MAENGFFYSVNDTLSGGLGDDYLEGGAGVDTMIGGQGNDVYTVDNIGDVVTENVNEGTDYVTSTITYTLGANLENLTLSGTAVINGTGNALNNSLYGNAVANTLNGGLGDDYLEGGAGVDTMIGGQGNDVYNVDNIGDVVTENVNEGTDYVTSTITYTLGGNVENLTLSGADSINGTGNALNNSLYGNAVANTLNGGLGDDYLEGGAGVDTMIGGQGNDVYNVDNIGDVVTENVYEGTDYVTSTITYTLGANVENLTLSGTAVINGTGNELANVLSGNSATNTLDGLDGNDTLYAGDTDTAHGGAGNDTLISENTGSWTYLYGEAGDDTLTGGSHSGFFAGGLGNDIITGGLGMNFIWGDEQVAGGEGGNDIIKGGNDYDYVIAGYGDDLVYGNGGGDNLSGNAGNDTLYGGAGNDTLLGGLGNDHLDGGAGADTMTGGVGDDTYILGRGYDADTIVENDATAGNTDIAQFLSGVASDQIWFQQVGNNLEASIIGTGDKLVVKDWYLGTANHVEQFKTTDGAQTLLDSNVQNLVNAMASFAPPAAGQTSLPSNYQTSLAPVIAANWQ